MKAATGSEPIPWRLIHGLEVPAMQARMRHLFAVVLILLATSQAAIADLRSDVQALVSRSQIKGATIAVSVRDSETGRELIDINDDSPMIPASNMKLLTTGTALHVLGEDFEFQTKLLLEGDCLIVVGDGDPAFGDPELLSLVSWDGKEGVTIEQFLNVWIEAVRKRGLKSIRRVVVDARIFDHEFTHSTWPRDQLNRRYCAEVSGLNFHLNLLHFYPRPVHGGPPDVSQFEPWAGWVEIGENRATSKSSPGDGNTFGIARPYGSNRLTFFGNVKNDYSVPVPVTVHDMATFFARLLADRLARAGAPIETYGEADPAFPHVEGEVVAPIVRTPISTIVTRCNRDSQNLYAESLLKRSGYAVTSGTQPGSFINGAAAIRLVLDERLRERSGLGALIVADGSGLSRDNRVTASLLTAWLDSFHRDARLGPVFIDSLALGGVSGTLKNRFNDSRFSGVTVQAKSGFINGVSCLSGFVTASDGRRRSFSILLNNLPAGGVGTAKALQEEIVGAITADLLSTMPIDIGG